MHCHGFFKVYSLLLLMHLLHVLDFVRCSQSYTRPDAVLYSVSIGMSVGSLLSANVKTINYLLHYIISPVSTILPH